MSETRAVRVKPAPVDYFAVAPYTRKDLTFHITGGVLCAATWLAGIAWLVAAWRAERPAALGVALAVLAAMYCADLVSGLLHWAFDTWFDEDMGFIRRMVIMVREHHVYPQRIFQFSVFHDAGTLSWIAFFLTAPLVLGAILAATPAAGLLSYAVATAVVFTPLLVFMLEFHKCGHRRESPLWVRVLQRAGLLLSWRHHIRHHSGNHDINYCLINGWADRTLGRLGLFRGLERAIERLTGAVPQHNDHEWLARCGRKVVGRPGKGGGPRPSAA